jgi:hypothetical protein
MKISIQYLLIYFIVNRTEIVDFGTLSAINKTVSRNLKITNKGAVDGEFIINYKGNMPITFVPFRDIVPAFSSSLIRVKKLIRKSVLKIYI